MFVKKIEFELFYKKILQFYLEKHFVIYYNIIKNINPKRRTL